MKTVVCREDIKAEMQMLSNMQYDLQLLQSQVSMLQDRLELLEAKNSVINAMNTSVNVPTITGDTGYGQGISDLVDIRRAAAEAGNEIERTVPDGHWEFNNGRAVYVSD